MLIEVVNKKLTIEVIFNDYAQTFSASKLSIDKGAGNRLMLAPNKNYLHIIYATSDSVVEVLEYSAFDSGAGVPFASMEALYDRLVQYMEDRTGTI